MTDPMTRISLSSFAPGERLSFFGSPAATEASACDDGVLLTAVESSRDPHVNMALASLLSAAGIGGYTDASDFAALVCRVKSEAPGTLEVFFACGETVTAAPGCSADDRFRGGGTWEYMVLDFSASASWRGALRDGFRLDWSGYVREGDALVLSDLYLFADADKARAFAAEGNAGRRALPVDGVLLPEQPETLSHKGYYVCLDEYRLASLPRNILICRGTLAEAVSVCDSVKQLGYRVCDETGRLLYAPYPLLQCDILREAKYVTDYAREHGFRYGDAPVNPAIDCRAGYVSCDRLVCWALYRLGFVDQPFSQGVVVSKFPEWCRRMGFTQLFDVNALEPGDIMLVRRHPKGFPEHTFLFAGYAAEPDADPAYPCCPARPGDGWDPAVRNIFSFRYDCGSNERIRSVQPTEERLFNGANLPFETFRPVATRENCVNWERYQ